MTSEIISSVTTMDSSELITDVIEHTYVESSSGSIGPATSNLVSDPGSLATNPSDTMTNPELTRTSQTSVPPNPESTQTTASSTITEPDWSSPTSSSGLTSGSYSVRTSQSSVTSLATSHSTVIATTSELRLTTVDYGTTEVDSNESGLSQGAIIGISVGVSLAIVVVIVAIFVAVLLRKRKNNKRAKYTRDGDNPNDYKLDIHKNETVNSPSAPGAGTQNMFFNQHSPDSLSADDDLQSERNDNNPINIDNSPISIDNIPLRVNNGFSDKVKMQDSRMSLGPLLLGADDPEMSKQMLSEMSSTNTFK